MAVFQTSGEMSPDGRHLTSAILNKISAANPVLAANIHDGRDGYMYGQRIYKALTHSQVLGGMWDKDKRAFLFPGGHAILYLGWREDVVDAFTRGVKLHPDLRLGTTFNARLITVADVPLTDPGTDSFMPCGPVVVKHEGKYVEQRESPLLFIKMLKDNLLRKYTAMEGCPPESGVDIDIPRRMQTVPMRWGDFKVIGNRGTVQIKGNSDFIKFILAVGIGKYNSIGCGMLLPA
jgi:CRISPR-associated endoribonuclease Cas6